MENKVEIKGRDYGKENLTGRNHIKTSERLEAQWIKVDDADGGYNESIGGGTRRIVRSTRLTMQPSGGITINTSHVEYQTA